jgi:small GTP-binding protein
MNKDVRILLVGLDAAGKTTIMYKLKMEEAVRTIPTVSFNVETMNYKNLSINMWDVGGQDRIRALWNHYYNAVIYVVDFCDVDRIEESCYKLHKMLEDEELAKVSVLIYANKQDLTGALKPNESAERMKMSDFEEEVMVQGSSALKGNGLTEGFDWVAKALK